MIVLLSTVGILAVGSAEESLQSKQLIGVIAGFVMMIIISLLNYKWLLKLYWFMYIGNLILLLLVEFLGKEGGYGAQRWLRIGSFQFQPSETAKILLILFFAQFIMKHKEKLNTFPMIIACVILILIPWYLIFDQPDLSTSIVVLMIFCVIMFTKYVPFG
jgi:rod shape determining protein RodA